METLPSATPRKRLGDLLIEKGLVKPEAVDAALHEQRINGDRLGMILVRNGFLSHQALIETVLETNPEDIISEQIFSTRVPPALLIEFKVMLVAETDGQLFAGTLEREHHVKHMLAKYYPEKQIKFVPLDPVRLDDYLDKIRDMDEEEGSFVDVLLRRALAEQISDVHILPRYDSYSVMFRYMGVRRLAHEGSMEEYHTLSARIKDRARMDLAERRVPQDGGFQVEHNSKLIDMRVATLPTPDGEAIVIRLLDPDRVQPSLDGLGITKVTDWRAGVSRSDGLCLICGPTGSGKTTTLNATVKEMDRFGRAIYTVEDPVEYRIPFTGQVNTNPSVGLDFSRAVRAFLRADPDCIILGEIRDEETARNAVKAAETGHMVLGTLHTGTIRGAVDRLRDLGVEAHELRYLLRSVLVQRLIRVVCKSCGGAGCDDCFGTGYTGREVVSETAYFPGLDEVSAMIKGDEPWDSMLDDALLKYKQGTTDAPELIRVFGAEAEKALRSLGTHPEQAGDQPPEALSLLDRNWMTPSAIPDASGPVATPEAGDAPPDDA